MRHAKVYRITVEDESRLQTIVSKSLTPMGLLGLGCSLLAVSVLLGFLLVWLTPIKHLLPGYLRESQRAASVEAIVRLDSLQDAYIRNEVYIANILSLLDTHRKPSDSVTAVNRTLFVSDSLLGRSAEETRFAKMMREREKFNISLLASMAAEGILLYPVCDESFISPDSRDAFEVEMQLPAGANLMALADGVIIDAYYDIRTNSYIVITQHDNGFISRIIGLGDLMVGRGDKVQGGEILCSAPRMKSKLPIKAFISLWHNGTPVKPYDYIIGHRYRINQKSRRINSTSTVKASQGNGNQVSDSLSEINNVSDPLTEHQ